MFFFKKEFTANVAESLIKSIIKEDDKPSFKDLYNIFDMYEDKDLVGFLKFELVLADMIIFTKVGKNAANIFRSELFGQKYTITNGNIVQQITFQPDELQDIANCYYEFMYEKAHIDFPEKLVYLDALLQPMVKNFVSNTTDYIILPLIILDFFSMLTSIRDNFNEKIKKYK